jgi:hypothetical protein
MARSDSQGRFAFSPKLAPQKIFVSHEEGYGEAKVSDVLKGGPITLQKWSRVKGVVRIGDRIEPNQNVRLMNSPQRIYEANAPLPFLSVSLRADPEPDGSFVFEKVPAGEHRVALEYRLKDENVYEAALSHAVPVVGRPGETIEIVLGGSGRRVTGRVQIVGGDSGDVDWQRDVHKLVSVQPPDGRGFAAPGQTYVLLVESNGTFRADNVPPGNYSLAINVSDPEDEYYNRRPIGSVTKPVTVPNERDAKVNAPFDIGSVELTIRPRVKIGKVVPSFDGKTAEGKTIQLSDYRGKYVLLYFWGRTMGYSTYDFQVLKEIQSSYGASGRLVILGCNLDPDIQDAAQFAKSQNQTWTQVYLGSWNQSPIPGMFGLQGNTACVLIDPEGKLASNQLRGTAIRNLVTNAMANE